MQIAKKLKAVPLFILILVQCSSTMENPEPLNIQIQRCTFIDSVLKVLDENDGLIARDMVKSSDADLFVYLKYLEVNKRLRSELTEFKEKHCHKT